jgi:hypothetical protein
LPGWIVGLNTRMIMASPVARPYDKNDARGACLILGEGMEHASSTI